MDMFVCLYRCCFHCGRFFSKNKHVKQEVPVTKIPWLSIGTTHQSHTELINKNLKFGVIDKLFLEKVTGDYSGSWSYLDSTTLEEKEFPSSGILIENGEDFVVSNSE